MKMGKECQEGKLILILGGARSGKSAFAQKLAQSQKAPVAYVASALPLDEEMVRRIDRHKKLRPHDWLTVEAPYSADTEVVTLCRGKKFVIWDCVTVFLTNLLLEQEKKCRPADRIEDDIIRRFENMLSRLEGCPGTLAVVSNEVGSGIVPEYPLGRNFRDLAGRVNQIFAKQADKVFFTVAGLPIEIKENAFFY